MKYFPLFFLSALLCFSCGNQKAEISETNAAEVIISDSLPPSDSSTIQPKLFKSTEEKESVKMNEIIKKRKTL